MINKANIIQLANFIESHSELPFEMSCPFMPDTCGTAGCIAGFGAALWPEVQYHRHVTQNRVGFHASSLGEGKLGLECRDWKKLFYIANEYLDADRDRHHEFGDTGEPIDEYDLITRKGAIATLRRLAATGKVEWLQEEQV